ELGQALQSRHRDGALASFIGAQHRCLELLIRHGLDGLQREAHLFAHGAQARPHRSRISSAGSLLLLILVGYHRLVDHDHQILAACVRALLIVSRRQPPDSPCSPVDPQRVSGGCTGCARKLLPRQCRSLSVVIARTVSRCVRVVITLPTCYPSGLGPDNGLRASPTRPLRRAHNSRPLATAAVSARRKPGPRPTTGNFPGTSSESSHPPSRPTAMAGIAP